MSKGLEGGPRVSMNQWGGKFDEGGEARRCDNASAAIGCDTWFGDAGCGGDGVGGEESDGNNGLSAFP
jgi:hypothetical protein